MSEEPFNPTPLNGSNRFVTTHWTQVLASCHNSEEGRQALSDLCAAYYAPVVAFLRTQTHSEDASRELAHDFFAVVLARGSLAGADPTRGRFRSYLLGALKHFLANRHARENRQKRGGGAIHEPILTENDTSAEIRIEDSSLEPPDKAFERAWAMTILEQALQSLKKESEQNGKGREFEVLKPWLTGESAGGAAEAARKLGLSDGAFRVATHRLRHRFRELVRGQIAPTVQHPSEITAEMHHLIEALS